MQRSSARSVEHEQTDRQDEAASGLPSRAILGSRSAVVELVRRPGVSLSDLLAAADALELAAMQFADAERRGERVHTESTRAALLKARTEHSALAAQLVNPPHGFAETVMEAVGCLQRNSATRLARRLQAYLR
jgi:hypothetical protein